MDHHLIGFYLVLVPVLGMLAQWLAWRVHVPSILVLLAFGIALGIWIRPDTVLAATLGAEESSAPKLLFPIVSLSVAIILFEGGLTLHWQELKKCGHIVFRLITIGAVCTMVLSALVMHFVMRLSWPSSCLLGAILMVTGPTVVGPLLRQIRPSKNITSILKWEGILIDPVGAIAAVLVFEAIAHWKDVPWTQLIGMLVLTFLLGTTLGLLTAYLLIVALKNYWLPDYLHGAMFLAVSLAAFFGSNYLIHESGLVTVTILGIALANQKSVSVEHVLEFKEHLRVLLISCLFILLGSRLQIANLFEIGLLAIPMLLLLLFVVRPISVWLSTIGCGLNWQERLFVGLISPRGIVAAAVSSVFGLKLLTSVSPEAMPEMLSEAELLVPITFVVIIGTVLFCGLFAAPIARRLGLADTDPQGILFAGASPMVRSLAAVIQKLGIEVTLLDTNHSNVSVARMDGMTAVCGNVLSDHLREELSLGGLGRFVAFTPNDEVNTLSVQEFIPVFGRANTFQVALSGKMTGRFQKVPEHRRGRVLFEDELNYNRLAQLYEEGWQFKTPQMTDTFSYEDFKNMHQGRAIPLFRVTSDGKLTSNVVGTTFTASSGDTLIALMPPVKESHPN